MKKFLDQEQIVHLQKGEFVNTYIFKYKFDKLKVKPLNFRDCNLQKKKKDFQIIKVHQFLCRKREKNIHKIGLNHFDKYSIPLSLNKEV